MKRRDFLIGTGLAIGSMVFARDILASGDDERHEYRHDKEDYEYAHRGRYRDYNRLRNRSAPTVLEQKHVPLIEIPEKVKRNEWFDIRVKVGFLKEHPSTPEHWITGIYLIVNGRKVAKAEYKVGGISASEARFRIKLSSDATIEAIEHCNLHGTWISDPVKIRVI